MGALCYRQDGRWAPYSASQLTGRVVNLLEKLHDAERDRDFWEGQYDDLLKEIGGVSPPGDEYGQG